MPAGRAAIYFAMIHILILSGAGDARDLARLLRPEPGLRLTLSYADRPRRDDAARPDVRVGGFGGAAGLRRFLTEARVDAVIDATHPFARVMPERSLALCRELGLPHLRLLRPGWSKGPGDRWHRVRDAAAAAARLTPGAVLFVASGRDTLAPLERVAGDGPGGVRIICRQIEAPGVAFPFAGGRFLQGTPPFSVEEEERLFRALGVDALLVKDAGGAASRTKLDAARRLGLEVFLIDRPPPPKGAAICNTAQEAAEWARSIRLDA